MVSVSSIHRSPVTDPLHRGEHDRHGRHAQADGRRDGGDGGGAVGGEGELEASAVGAFHFEEDAAAPFVGVEDLTARPSVGVDERQPDEVVHRSLTRWASDVGGFKEVVINMKGNGAYRHLRFEAGGTPYAFAGGNAAAPVSAGASDRPMGWLKPAPTGPSAMGRLKPGSSSQTLDDLRRTPSPSAERMPLPLPARPAPGCRLRHRCG